MARDRNAESKLKVEQERQHAENMKLPINQFLNAQNEDGTSKYEVGNKLYKYFINNPDPVLDDVRMANAYLHQIRFLKHSSTKCLEQYHSSEPVTLKDGQGNLLSKDECFLNSISQQHQVHTTLSKLRSLLVNNLLAKCTGDTLTFEQYNQYVLDVEKKVSELGYTLLPTTVEMIPPL